MDEVAGRPSELSLFIAGFIVLSVFIFLIKLPAIIRYMRQRGFTYAASGIPDNATYYRSPVISRPSSFKEMAQDVRNTKPIDREWLLDDAELQTQRIKLSTVASADNVLVVGQKDAGKTTLLKKIVAKRSTEECIALDPHAKPGKWHCYTVGAGRDYAAIGMALSKIATQMDKRFKQMGMGEIDEGAFSRRSVVSDEYRSIADELNGKGGTVDAGKLLLSRISEGRKVGECALVACHNDTVEALGIQGNADMKTCFDYIIYMGALVDSNRTNKAPQDVKDIALKLERPAVVWHPARNNWYVLDDDLPMPVLIGGTKSEGIENGQSYQYRTGTESGTPDTSAVLSDTPLSDDILITELVRRGKSANMIFEIVGGSRSAVLEKVRKAKETLDTL